MVSEEDRRELPNSSGNAAQALRTQTKIKMVVSLQLLSHILNSFTSSSPPVEENSYADREKGTKERGDHQKRVALYLRVTVLFPTGSDLIV